MASQGAMKPKFQPGDHVSRIAFTGCSGESNPQITGLIVGKVTLVEGYSMPAYYRVLATNHEGFPRAEGAERFFEHA